MPGATNSDGPALKSAVVSISTQGDNTIIASGTRAIRIHRLKLVANGTVSMTFKAGSTSLSGAEPCQAQVLEYEEVPWYVCEAGDAFIISLSAAVQVGGTVWYREGV